MLKADLHLHCNKDPDDPINFSPKQLIDHAATLKFEVLAITCHNRQYYNKEIASYAKTKGIILIPGVEVLLQIR